METAQFSHLLAHTHQQLTPSDYQALKALAAQHPYAAAIHALVARQAVFFESADRAKELLAVAATHAPDRLALRHFIEDKPMLKAKVKPIPVVTKAEDAPEADQVLVVTADQLKPAQQPVADQDPNIPAWMKDIDEDPIWLSDPELEQILPHAEDTSVDVNLLIKNGDISIDDVTEGPNKEDHQAAQGLTDNFDPDHEASFGQELDDQEGWPGLGDDLEKHRTAAENTPLAFEGHQYPVPEHEALSDEDHAVIGEYLLAEVDGHQTAPDESIMLGPDDQTTAEASSFTTIDPSEAVSDISTALDEEDELVAEQALHLETESDIEDVALEHSLAAGVSEDDLFDLSRPLNTSSFFEELPDGPTADITEEDAALHDTDSIIAELLAELDKYQELKKHSPLDLGHAGEDGPDAHSQFDSLMAEASESPISEKELDQIFHPELEVETPDDAAEPEVEEPVRSADYSINELGELVIEDGAANLKSVADDIDQVTDDEVRASFPEPSDESQIIDHDLPKTEMSIYEQLLAEQGSDAENLQADASLLTDQEVADSNIGPMVQETDEDDQDSIISRFLDTNPKITIIKPADDIPVYDLSAHNQPLGEEDITENLAQIMVKQGKLDKAIEIYCKLILKNPEKTSYFASRINALAGAMGDK